MAQLLALGAALGLISPWLVQALADYSDELAWLFDLASHWQWSYLALLFASVLVLLRRGERYWLLLLPLSVLPWFSAAPTTRALDGQVQLNLHVLTANLQQRQDANELRSWLNHNPADVLFLQEVTAELAEQLTLWDDYPHQVLAPDASPFGLALLSRIALDGAFVEVADDAIPRIEARLLSLPQPVTLSLVHPMPPISPYWHQQLKAHVHTALLRNASSELPGILAGDLNASPWSQAIRPLHTLGWLRASDLQPTWPAWGYGVFGIAIDHVLLRGPWRVTEQSVGPNLGADHLPRSVHLQLLEHPSHAQP